ncbi:MAG: M16 family metallopeptidase [Persicimonas sp.]
MSSQWRRTLQRITGLSGLMVACGLLLTAACTTGSGANGTPPSDRDIPERGSLETSEGDPEVEELGEVDGTRAFEVGDVTVLHKETPANSVVAARVYISGGSANLTEETAGIERLALNTAVNGGTESHPRDEFNAALDSMGSSVGSFDDRDFSGYTMKSVVDSFDKTWDLMVESMVEPELPEEELERQRERHLADIRALRDNPDRYVSYVASKLLFYDHPYDNLQLGEEEKVANFTREEVAAYQRAMLQPDRMTVVVVGNVSDDEIIERVEPLARIDQEAEIERAELTDFDADKPRLDVAQKDIPTNYIFGLYPAPAAGDEDYEAMRVATEHLKNRLFEEVRTKRNLTYSVSAGLSDRRTNYGYLYVTAVDPEQTMAVIYHEIDRLKAGEFDEEELDRARNVYITNHYMSQETNDSQASLLARAHLIEGDWKSHATTIDRLREVTAEDVERVANEYIKNYHFGFVGNEDAARESVFLRQEVPEVDEIDEELPEDGEGSQPPPPPQPTPEGESPPAEGEQPAPAPEESDE